MNKQTLQQKLRSLINEACPELLVIGFGCKVHHNSTEGLVIERVGENEDNKWSIYWNGGNYNISTYEIEDIEIIGKEPTLSHLLRAIDKKYKDEKLLDFSLTTTGTLIEITGGFSMEVACELDLTLPPLEQSEETLLDLIELLS